MGDLYDAFLQGYDPDGCRVKLRNDDGVGVEPSKLTVEAQSDGRFAVVDPGSGKTLVVGLRTREHAEALISTLVEMSWGPPEGSA